MLENTFNANQHW